MKTNSVPKIRFKGFTDDWEQRKVSEYANFFTGNGLNWNDVSDDGEQECILYGNLYTDYGMITENIVYRTNTEIKNPVYSEYGDVLIPASDTTPTGLARATSLEKSGVLLGGDINIIRPNKGINGSCLSLALNANRKELIRLIKGTTVRHIHNSEIKDIVICLPKLETEQVRISSYFKQLDRLITLHQRKCDQTKELKKFMLQKMFPKKGEKNPEIRFSGFTDDWEQRKLGELGRATGGTSIESEFSENGKYKVISIGSYSEDSVYREQGIRAIESEKTKNRVLNEGDLTMILNDKTTSGNIIGRVLLIEKSDVYVYNQRTERIEINHDKFDSLFVYEMLNAPQIRNKIIKQSQGNTQIYVNWPTIAETRYLIPQIVEQQKIGEYFLNLDRLITLHQRKCEQLKELKKFMLQNMFPKKG